MPVKYSLAPEVEKVAREIIRDHHDHLIANNVRVDFLFCSQTEKHGGKTTLGTARKHGGINAFLALSAAPDYDPLVDGEEFFTVTIWQQAWDDLLDEDGRRALVDHECCHLWSEEDEKADREPGDPPKIKLSITGHSIEEFNQVVARHGAWQPDLRAFLKALNSKGQLTLVNLEAA